MATVVAETPDGPVTIPMDRMPDDQLREWAAMGNEEARAILRARAASAEK